MFFWRPVAPIVVLVPTIKRKESLADLDVELIAVILSGGIASFMLVLETTMFNIAGYTKNFLVTYLSINMVQNMDRKVPLYEQDF